jgi:hypothetical protein
MGIMKNCLSNPLSSDFNNRLVQKLCTKLVLESRSRNCCCREDFLLLSTVLQFRIRNVLAHRKWTDICSVAEPHHFYAAPAPGKNFDAAPTLLYGKAKFLKRTEV